MKSLSFVILLLLIVTGIIGCSDTENPLEPADLTENTATGVFAEAKRIKAVPTAPTAPQTLTPGTPFIKEVGYYSDWQLTEPITESVAVGTKVFIKIVFSEPMKHVVSDDEKARPILYHRRMGKDEQLVQFKMAAHGASGENFIAGDAKPFQVGTDDYVCKYRVVPEDAGREVAIMIGKWSVDLEGNPLATFYTHPVKLQVKPTAAATEEVEEVPMVPAEEITAEIAYYNDAELTDNLAAALSADVWDPTFNHFRSGDTVYATVTFSHPLQVVEQANPVLFMTLNSEKIARFTPTSDTLTSGTYKEEESENRYVCKYTFPDGAFGVLRLVVEIGEEVTTSKLRLQAVLSLLCTVDSTATELAEVTRRGATDFVGRVLTPRYDPPVIPLEGVRVTVMAGPKTGESTVTDQDGEFVFPNVAGDALHVRLEKACYETKEMLVYRSRPTALSDGTVLRYENNRHRNTPGVILMGHTWPEPVRPLLELMTLPHDLLYFYEPIDHPYASYISGGFVAKPVGSPEKLARIDDLLLLFAHELFHAHQHATVAIDGSGNIFDWVHTPDGLAYLEAQRKDREAFGKCFVDWHPIAPGPIEFSANTIEIFLWSITAADADRARREAMPLYQELKNKAPHRLKWAQEWYERAKRR